MPRVTLHKETNIKTGLNLCGPDDVSKHASAHKHHEVPLRKVIDVKLE